MSDYIEPTRIGDTCRGRVVTQQDIERWEQQRQLRKRKKVKLNPYR